jgi:general secretion pathway protein J
LFYFRENAWTNPQSSDASGAAAIAAAAAAAASGAAPAAPPNAATPVLPDGVRLVLMLPPGQAISGTLTRDWVRPTLAANKS